MESNTSHVKALICSDQSLATPNNSSAQSIINTTSTEPLVQQTSTPNYNTNNQSPDLVPDVDLTNICLTELLDSNISGLLSPANFRHSKMDEKSLMEITEEFWSVDEQNLFSNSNLDFADCIADWLV